MLPKRKTTTAEQLASLFGGIGPEEIPEFRRAQGLILAYQLLHSLIQTAALEALVACGYASSSQHELNEALYWLTGYARDRDSSGATRGGQLAGVPAGCGCRTLVRHQLDTWTATLNLAMKQQDT